MDSILEILVAAFIGTANMTLLSHIVSRVSGHVYQEPLLLRYVMDLCGLKINENLKDIFGWLGHYVLGVLFVSLYHLLWNCCFDLSWSTALLLGVASGILGIVGWWGLFNLPAAEPRVDYLGYYTQLFFAHIVFALTVFVVYRFWF